MKPIENTYTTKFYFNVGDFLPGGEQVLALIACPHTSLCRRDYLNFGVCGGFHRVLSEGRNRRVCCPFFTSTKKDYLTDHLDGEPLL